VQTGWTKYLHLIALLDIRDSQSVKWRHHMLQVGKLGLDFPQGKENCFPGRGKSHLLCKASTPPLGPIGLLFIGYWEIFAGGKTACPCWPLPFSTAVKKEWRYTFISPYTLSLRHCQYAQSSEVKNAWNLTFTFPIRLHGVVHKGWGSFMAVPVHWGTWGVLHLLIGVSACQQLKVESAGSQ
jgi:hypothetical protein